MATYQRNLDQCHLSLFGITATGAGSGGFLKVTFPDEYGMVQGQGGDGVGYKTGNSVAEFELTVLQSHSINEDLIGRVNYAREHPEDNGQGEFLFKDLQTGQTVTGDCVLRGYPNDFSQNAEESDYVWKGYLFNYKLDIAKRELE